MKTALLLGVSTALLAPSLLCLCCDNLLIAFISVIWTFILIRLGKSQIGSAFCSELQKSLNEIVTKINNHETEN